jgi:hypothetical protein
MAYNDEPVEHMNLRYQARLADLVKAREPLVSRFASPAEEILDVLRRVGPHSEGRTALHVMLVDLMRDTIAEITDEADRSAQRQVDMIVETLKNNLAAHARTITTPKVGLSKF